MKNSFKKAIAVVLFIYILAGCSPKIITIHADVEAYNAIAFTPDYTIGIRVSQYSINLDTDRIRLKTSMPSFTVPRPQARNAEYYLVPALLQQVSQRLGVTTIDVTESSNVYSAGGDRRSSVYRNIRKKYPDVDAVLDVRIVAEGTYNPSDVGEASGTLRMNAHLFTADDPKHLLWGWGQIDNNNNITNIYYEAKGNFPFSAFDYKVAENFNTIFDGSKERALKRIDALIRALAKSRE